MSRPLRILFLSMEYPPETGGGGIGPYVATVAPALAVRGHTVHVLSCAPRQPKSDRFQQGVWIHRRPQIRVKGSSRVLGRMFPQAAPRILAAASTRFHARRLGVDFDVIEAPEWMAEGLLVGRTRPVVTHLHTPVHLIARHNGGRVDGDLRIADRLERSAARTATIVTTPSELLARRLAETGWLDGRSPVVVRNPVEIDRWAACPPLEGTGPTVLSVGRIERRKSPETLVDAAAELRTSIADIEVVFIGRSNGRRGGQSYQRWVEERARRIGTPCRFIEHVPRDQLLSWYGRARVVALASAFDNFPMVGLESMAAGRPVVCSSETGLAELVAGSDAGSVVPPRDPTSLAGALRPYLVDTSLAVAAGRSARALVSRHCSPALVAELRERQYVEAMERWGSPRRGTVERAAG